MSHELLVNIREELSKAPLKKHVAITHSTLQKLQEDEQDADVAMAYIQGHNPIATAVVCTEEKKTTKTLLVNQLVMLSHWITIGLLPMSHADLKEWASEQQLAPEDELHREVFYTIYPRFPNNQIATFSLLLKLAHATYGKSWISKHWRKLAIETPTEEKLELEIRKVTAGTRTEQRVHPTLGFLESTEVHQLETSDPLEAMAMTILHPRWLMQKRKKKQRRNKPQHKVEIYHPNAIVAREQPVEDPRHYTDRQNTEVHHAVTHEVLFPLVSFDSKNKRFKVEARLRLRLENKEIVTPWPSRHNQYDWYVTAPTT